MNSLFRIRILFAAVVAALSFAPNRALAQSDISGFLPPGVSVSTATPQQVADAVAAATRQNPDAVVDISTNTFRSIVDAGRYTLPGEQDNKQVTEDDGSSSEPTLDEWAQTISDAAKQANPSMATQIDSAMASALTSALATLPSVTSPGVGDPGTAAPPPPTGFGGGGGTSTSNTGTSN